MLFYYFYIRMDLNLNKIYNYECLEGLNKLDDCSIDLIITSPPYNLGNNHHTANFYHQPYDDDMKESKYQEWQTKVLNECYRVLKPNGSMMYNHKNRIQNGVQITPYEWLFKTKFIIKQEIIWINQSPNFDNIRFYPWTERVYWLTKKASTQLNNVLGKSNVFDWNEWKPVGTKNKKHTRQFPIKLVTDLLKVFPNAEIILDPFMGSGTTAVGCVLEERKYIGFEIKEEFVKLSRDRIKKVKKEEKSKMRITDFLNS